MKAIIRIDVHEYQIGQEVSCYFKDTMNVYGVCEAERTGHWERTSIDLYVQHATAYYQCSECGEKVIGKHNYCQFCGAKMVEPQESEG